MHPLVFINSPLTLATFSSGCPLRPLLLGWRPLLAGWRRTHGVLTYHDEALLAAGAPICEEVLVALLARLRVGEDRAVVTGTNQDGTVAALTYLLVQKHVTADPCMQVFSNV